MKTGHFEITFEEIGGYNDYVSKNLKEAISQLVQSTWFQDYTVKEIKWVEDKE